MASNAIVGGDTPQEQTIWSAAYMAFMCRAPREKFENLPPSDAAPYGGFSVGTYSDAELDSAAALCADKILAIRRLACAGGTQ